MVSSTIVSRRFALLILGRGSGAAYSAKQPAIFANLAHNLLHVPLTGAEGDSVSLRSSQGWKKNLQAELYNKDCVSFTEHNAHIISLQALQFILNRWLAEKQYGFLIKCYIDRGIIRLDISWKTHNFVM